MKKAIALVVMCLMACTTMALATDLGVAVPVNKAIPAHPERTGTCAVTAVPDSASMISLWSNATWVNGSAHGMYIDPASEDTTAGCAAPFYPFHATSVDFLMAPYNDDTLEVGLAATFLVEFCCPKDFGSGTVTEDCQGPGVPFATYTITHTLLREYYDANGIGLLYYFNFPVDVCVDRPFFLTVRQIAWNGSGTQYPPQILWHQQNGALTQAGKRCDNWLSLPAVGYTCWLLTGYDIGYGCTTPPPGFTACFPGAAFMYVNGNAGEPCNPAACAPLPNNYPGDDASNPIVVNASPWNATVNLCNYTSDYNYYDDAGAAPVTTRRFTGRGNDVVLQIAFDAALPEACFAVTLTPQCTAPDILRLRTWIRDSYGPLYWGNPQYPNPNIAQTYNFTSSGIGCQLPDTYLLYIDGYPCCCPVAISYSGDTPLPVELADFDAIAGNGQVTLTWITRSETSIERYEITRDGELLASVEGLGDNPSGHTYSYLDRDVINGMTYTYSLTAYGMDGTAIVFPRTESATPEAGLVTEYSLSQNYPNPFNPTTAIAYTVKDAGLVTLKVYSIDGREVATLVNGSQPAGAYTVNFEGKDLASGVYLYKLEVNGYSATHKMVLMK